MTRFAKRGHLSGFNTETHRRLMAGESIPAWRPLQPAVRVSAPPTNRDKLEEMIEGYGIAAPDATWLRDELKP